MNERHADHSTLNREARIALKMYQQSHQETTALLREISAAAMLGLSYGDGHEAKKNAALRRVWDLTQAGSGTQASTAKRADATRRSKAK